VNVVVGKHWVNHTSCLHRDWIERICLHLLISQRIELLYQTSVVVRCHCSTRARLQTETQSLPSVFLDLYRSAVLLSSWQMWRCAVRTRSYTSAVVLRSLSKVSFDACAPVDSFFSILYKKVPFKISGTRYVLKHTSQHILQQTLLYIVARWKGGWLKMENCERMETNSL